MPLAVQAALLAITWLAQDPQIPAPRGYVNDFAGVIGAERVARIERIIGDVRAKSGGEIVVVTLPDIGDREVGDVALRIGREWKVGAAAEVGDRKRNTGLVILVVPKETSADGRGYIGFQTGNGVEGFITDSRAGDIRREAMPFIRYRLGDRGSVTTEPCPCGRTHMMLKGIFGKAEPRNIVDITSDKEQKHN